MSHPCLLALLASTLLASVLLPSRAAAPLLSELSSVPPAAAETHALLASQKPLAAAIEAAEKDTGGLAHDAAFDPSGDVTVHVFSPTEHYVVVVDGSTAAVKTKTLRPRFPGVPVDGQWTELPSGLKYFDLVVGTGEKPASPTSRVKVHYTGWLTDGTKFDSSVDRGEPAQHKLTEFIKGWTEGVGSMSVGGKRKLIVPYELAFGPIGGRGVPPKAMVIFDVELLAVVQ